MTPRPSRPADRRHAGIVALTLALTCACGPRRFVVPAGVGEPAPDAAAAWQEATAACRAVTTYTAELHVSGHAGAFSLSSRSTIQTGVTATDQIRLEALAFGRLIFVLAGTGDRATFLRSSDHRILKARGEDIVDAITGLTLGPRALLAVLDGCGGQAADITKAVKYGDLLAVTTADARVYVRQQEGRWRTVAAELPGLQVDYRRTLGDWPTGLRLSSPAGRTPVVALSVAIQQIEVNTPLADVAFQVNEPADAVPLTLEDLRREGPLGGGGA
jgi:hypothetical protein